MNASLEQVKGRVVIGQQSQRMDFREQLTDLKARMVTLEQRLTDVRDRIQRLGTATQEKQYAVVARLRCTGCRICEQVCPVGAIRVTYVARVAQERCTGCGFCVQNCPQGALQLRTR